MKKILKTLCVVSARGGSKTVPGKNIWKVAGRPLIGYVLQSILDSGAFDKTVLSTDSDEIADVVRKSYPQIEIPFIRPEEFSGDDVPVTAVIKHALEFYDKENEKYDFLFSMQPTNPFTRAETINDMVAFMKREGCDSIVTISKVLHYHPFRSYRHEGESMKISPLTEYSTENFLQKQDRPDAYGLTGGILGRKSSLVREWDNRGFALGEDQRGYVVSDEEAFDLDTPFEMELLEGLMERREMYIL